MIHINEIKLPVDGTNDRFATQHNHCCDLWALWHDEKLTREQRDAAFERWFEERQRMELGIY